MMRRSSPPKHRHDGTSPLPLGMDWSPPPRKWSGRDTVWPHDYHTGWSYCVIIPSWVVLPKSRDSDPVVFYRVQVGVQSPEGITTMRGVLRRFNDFLKLFTDLKKAFPKKNIPPAPPKGLLRMKNRVLLEQRRRSLEEWMAKLLSDIDLSRSISVASFLELEAAARASFQDVNQQISEANPSGNGTISSLQHHPNSSLSVVAGSSSITSDYEKLVKYGIQVNSLIGKDTENGNASKAEFLAGDRMDFLPEADDGKVISHGRKLSAGSDGSLDLPGGVEVSRTTEILNNIELHFSGDTQIVLPLDQRHKMNRILMTMQQRLVTAKTDMEDLIARLHQEVAVKGYLTTKVKDLEVELETTKQKSKENLQQSILIERERVTQMQWDMEELRRKTFEMELKLKSKCEQDDKLYPESTKVSSDQEKDMLLEELDATKKQLENLLKQHEKLEMKSKSDIKVLVKEVKSLRSSQTQMKQELSRSLKEKSETEKLLQQERERSELENTARRKLLYECEILHNQLRECSLNFPSEDGDNVAMNSSPLSDALDLLTTSDNRIGRLLAEAPLLAQDNEYVVSGINKNDNSNNDVSRIDDELRKVLKDIFLENARLRKQVNSVIRRSLKMDITSENNHEDS
ncbi:unnamed protein product, partial [Vitis vinifera]